MKKVSLVLVFVILAGCGVWLMWYGEIDDSPGGMLLGLLMAAGGVYGIIKTVRKKKLS